jgi:hypothetical protein
MQRGETVKTALILLGTAIAYIWLYAVCTSGSNADDRMDELNNRNPRLKGEEGHDSETHLGI